MWDFLVDVVSEFLSWIGDIVSVFWGEIKGWWSKLLGYLEDALNKFKEVFIVDQRQKGGKELIRQLREKCPNSRSLRDMKEGDMFAIGVDENDNVGEMKDFRAEVKGEDKFDVYSQRDNGVLRMTN